MFPELIHRALVSSLIHYTKQKADFNRYIGISLMVVLFAYSCGVGGVYPVVGGETSSARLRAKSNALGFVMNVCTV